MPDSDQEIILAAHRAVDEMDRMGEAVSALYQKSKRTDNNRTKTMAMTMSKAHADMVIAVDAMGVDLDVVHTAADNSD